MENKELLRIFESTGALQTGHFLLTSGLHSPNYIQCALVLQYPQYREKLCREIVDFYEAEGESIDVVIAPAVGGIMVALEVGRLLGVRSIFAERVNDKMTLRRGFSLGPEESVLIVEDVVTTGGSVKEVVQLVEEVGSYIVGAACIVNRNPGKVDLGVPLFSVYESRMLTYRPEKCPLCKQGIPLVKPGSRGLS